MAEIVEKFLKKFIALVCDADLRAIDKLAELSSKETTIGDCQKIYEHLKAEGFDEE